MLEEIRNKIVKEIVYNLDNRGLFKGIDDEIKEEIVLELEETVSSIKEILKHYINRDEAETKEFEVRNEAYEDGFESANIVGKTIPISEVEEDLDYIFQNDEENTTYRRLKEKYKTNKEEEWVWCTECGKEKVYDGTICNSCKEWLVK